MRVVNFVGALATLISRTSFLRVLDGDDDATCRDGRARRLVPGGDREDSVWPYVHAGPRTTSWGVRGVQAARRSYR